MINRPEGKMQTTDPRNEVLGKKPGSKNQNQEESALRKGGRRGKGLNPGGKT